MFGYGWLITSISNYRKYLLVHSKLPGVWVTKSISSVPLFCGFLSIIETYECVSTNLGVTFTRSTILLTEKLTNVALHYNDVIMGTIASQIISLTIVYSTVYSDADERKHQSSASLAFVRGIHLGPGTSPHKWPVTRKISPFHDVIMSNLHPWTIVVRAWSNSITPETTECNYLSMS